MVQSDGRATAPCCVEESPGSLDTLPGNAWELSAVAILGSRLLAATESATENKPPSLRRG